ncbi:MAG: M3 family metallopeptidase [Enterobacterales bacterium]
MNNTLLNNFHLPPFSSINYEHILPAVKYIIKHCKNTIEYVTNSKKKITWNNFCKPIIDSTNWLSKIWSIINHLNSVQDNEILRNKYEESLKIIFEYDNWINHNRKLYQCYLSFYKSDNFNQLNIAQKRCIKNILEDFKFSGLELTYDKKQIYKNITYKLNVLSLKYNNNVLDSTNSWSKLIKNSKELSGVSKEILYSSKMQAKTIGEDGWLIKLDYPVYSHIMTYCKNIKLRKEMYYAYNTRASEIFPNNSKWDNSYIINEILKLRYKLANLLNFKNYAEKSLFKKMAKNSKEIFEFLKNLHKYIKNQCKLEFKTLSNFVKKNFKIEKIYPWDIMFYSEKQKKHLFSINNNKLREFFPENKVIFGLYNIIKKIYNVTVKERKNIEVWDKNVRFFEFFDNKKNLIGNVYLDIYSRPNKRCGAWMHNYLDRYKISKNNIQKPSAYIVCNFSNPKNNIKQSLLTHNEVITLFHEFGHVLQHLLTKIDIPNVSGINGIAWDAVEISSQFMENYCYEPEVIKMISGHFMTNKPIPEKILNNIPKLKNYQIALNITKQIEFSLFDMYIHSNAKYTTNILNTLLKVKKEISILPFYKWERFPNTFSHIFSGGYAAGYYSYLWSNIFSSAFWLKFKKHGIFDQTIGISFLNKFLSKGGSEDIMDLVISFLGEKPKIDAILNNLNIKK